MKEYRLPPKTKIRMCRQDKSANRSDPERFDTTVKGSFERDPRGRDDWYTARGTWMATARLAEKAGPCPAGTPVYRARDKEGSPMRYCICWYDEDAEQYTGKEGAEADEHNMTLDAWRKHFEEKSPC